MAAIKMITRDEAKKIAKGKTYCPTCDSYAKVTNGTCRYCRTECKGSNEFPAAGAVSGVSAKCDFCGKNIRLDNEFGRMRPHTVRS